MGGLKSIREREESLKGGGRPDREKGKHEKNVVITFAVSQGHMILQSYRPKVAM